MSRLDDLIKEYCPDGVEFRKICEVAAVERGKRVVRDQLPETGKYRVYQNSLTPLGFFNDSNFKRGTAFVIGAGAAGEIGFSDDDFWAADDCYPLVCGEHVNGRYLYHVLLSKQTYISSQVRKGSIPRLSRSVIENIRIPVPPIEVQREIVRILDNFTELSAELSTELSARKKQYEYYRDTLLTFGSETAHLPLEQCCTILDNKRKPVTKAARIAGDYPYYGANGIQDYVSDYLFDGTFVLVGEDGSVMTPSGNPVVNWACGKIWVNNHAHIIEEKKGVFLRYLYHYLQVVNVSSLIHGNIPKLTGGDFRAIGIPVPPIEEQREIVRLLDNFTEISAEISAEILARKKQYEYYRDKLLNFKEKTA